MTDGQKRPKPKRGLAPWQVVTVVVSVVIAVAGAGLMAYQATAGDPAPAATEPATGDTPTASGFAPIEHQPDDEPAAESESETDRVIDSASGAVFRLGFGFFAGFAIGYAMRTFVKITLVVVGVALLGLFGLQYAGLVDVDWEKISGGFQSFGSWATAQTKDFANFITGYLPSASAGLAGAFVGFRRK